MAFAKSPICPWNALHVAIIQDDAERVISLLVEHKTAVNSKTHSGNTPLHLAILNGNFQMIRFIIKCGAKVNATNNNGETPLHFAAEMENLRAIMLLSVAGANIDAEDDEGFTPVEWAIESGHTHIARNLVAIGAKCPGHFDDETGKEGDKEDEEDCKPRQTERCHEAIQMVDDGEGDSARLASDIFIQVQVAFPL